MNSERKGMIKIIGTHHFIKEDEIKKQIEEFNPDIVLVELCNGRITVIEHPELAVPERFSLLNWIVNIIKKKAEKEGEEYGSDMISAYKISKKKGIPVGLIDRPLVETKVFFKTIPLNEKITMFNEVRKFSSKKIKISDVINEVDNSNIDEVLFKLKLKCPNLYYYLVTSRDEYMISKIKSYLYDYPNKKILIFIGKGHLKQIESNLFKSNSIAEVVKGGNKRDE